MDNWIDKLKIGDTVLVKVGDDKINLIRKVERFTKTLIVLNTGCKFFKKDGAEYGKTYNYWRSKLVEATEDNILKIKKQHHKVNRIKWFETIRGYDLSTEVLDKIFKICEES